MGTKGPHTVTEAVGQLVLLDLRKRGISHSHAAKFLGIGRDTFTRRLDGPNGFTGNELERICALLETTPSTLLERAEAAVVHEKAAA